MFSVLGAEQFVEAEVGPAEDRASIRVHAAGARLEELVEDILEALEESTPESEAAGHNVTELREWLRRKKTG